MFTFDKLPQNDKKVGRMTSINESLTNLSTVLIESSLDIASSVSEYRGLMKKELQASNGVYNENVRNLISESTKDVLSKSIEGTQSAIDAFTALKKEIEELYKKFMTENKSIVEQYQPLLKQLNTTKCTYEVNVYNLDSLDPGEVFIRVMDYLNKTLKLNPANTAYQFDELMSVYRKYLEDRESVYDDFKRAILGVAPTVNVREDFFGLVQSTLVSTSKETKSVDDQIFSNLLDLDIDGELKALDGIILTLENELASLKQFRTKVVTSDQGDENKNNQLATLYIARSTIINKALSFVSEVIRFRVKVIEEKFSNYRKIIINTYESLTTGDSEETLNETYKPDEDLVIEYTHPACAVDRDIF